MKPLIIGLAILLVLCLSWVVTQDIALAQRYNLVLKNITQELSVSASLFFDPEYYSNGIYVFNDYESIKALESQMKTLMLLDDDFNPLLNSYWIDQASYKITFYDDSLIQRIYENGILTQESVFSYPALYEDETSYFTEVITEPTVIVEVNAGRSRTRINIIDNPLENIQISSNVLEEYRYNPLE